MEFCKAFNAKTNAKDQEGLIIPVVITILLGPQLHFHYEDPARAGACEARRELAKGSAEPNKNKVGKLRRSRSRRSRRLKCPILTALTWMQPCAQLEGPAEVWALMSCK